MFEKKSYKGDLDRRKNTFLLIGFVVILGLVYVGFELFATGDLAKEISIQDDELIIVMDEDVIATDPTPPPPPPPVAQQTEIILQLVEDNIKVNTDFDFSQDFDLDAAVEEYVPIPIVEEEVDNSPPLRFVEEMPEPAGGFDAMYAFLQSNLRYPEVARNNGISGQVFVEFVVEKDGSISGVKVLVGVYPELDQEAMRVVRMMPKWNPGKQMGKAVRCFYQIPIRFTIH
ncbi:MAG: energy transducer TonB [Bacteroidales bacterium]|jgi:protein TonB|nr:energy transducer TonB [Bacteroidales bacterium]